MERVTDTHVYFWGSELSNWYKCKFEYKNHKFDNSEQAFMWEKALYFNDTETAEKILNEPNPKQNKKLGREVKNFNSDEWLKVSYQIMVDVNYAKWSSNIKLKQLLLSTGDKTIVESSPFDKIWGIGLHWSDDRVLDEKKWEGMNLLGKCLMQVREKLK